MPIATTLTCSSRCGVLPLRLNADRLAGAPIGCADVFARAFGESMPGALNEVLRAVMRNKRALAEKLFAALLRRDGDEDGGAGGRSAGDKGKGKATAEPMRIVTLPMPEATSPTVRTKRAGRCGMRLNSAACGLRHRSDNRSAVPTHGPPARRYGPIAGRWV